MAKERIVVSGLAVLTAQGNNVNQFWEAMLSARSGIGAISRFDASQYRTRIAAELKTDLNELLGYSVSKYSINTQFALACAEELVRDAGIADGGGLDKQRIGICLGTGLGGIYYAEEGLTRLLEQGPGRVNPMCVPYVDPNSMINQIASKWGFLGQQFTVASACSSAANAMGVALDMIRSGRADAVLTGGVECTVQPLMLAGFDRLRAMSPGNDDPQNACRPFAKDRDGFVLGEGAALLFIEKESSARARGATVYAELAGFGCTGGGYHAVMPVPDGSDSVRCMQIALADASATAAEIDLINPHGTGTQLNDAAEYKAMLQVFGDRIREIPIAPTKQLTGHLLGAAGAIEAAHVVKSLHEGVLTPFKPINCEFDLNINFGGPIRQAPHCALSSSFGFGNNNASLVFRKL
ncbi:MAG TPA: beta-ketoacyl-[acyl-carrier-protein] synthase family protein [Candidatus Acidoferrum sp.]|nr:beta-ketoacyl-[acyl-carrier-protein] synthase family protein [Candidatus Acidoferrum sp.]